MSGERKPYVVTLSEVLPPEERGAFRALPPEAKATYKLVRPAGVGERGCYRVELTAEEAERAAAASNAEAVERDVVATPDVDSKVIAPGDLRFHQAELYQHDAWDGTGADVGVIDSGLGAGARHLFDVKASRSEVGGDPLTDPTGHGTAVAALAVPKGGRLVVGQVGAFSATSSDTATLIYWMVDQVGVTAINYSYGGYDPWGALAEVFSHAEAQGVPVFNSYGNEGLVGATHYPAAHRGVHGISSLDRRTGGYAATSNRGDAQWASASGVNVLTYDQHGNTSRWSGTSFASPIATFLYATKKAKAGNSISAQGVLAAMKATAGPNLRLMGEPAARDLPNRCGQ